MTQQDGTIVYNLDPTYVVQIIDPVSSYITVENSSMSGNVSLWGSYRKYRYTDMHYVAFSTDWDIDRLVSATVHYTLSCTAFKVMSSYFVFAATSLQKSSTEYILSHV